jgi:hypothetical protein
MALEKASDIARRFFQVRYIPKARILAIIRRGKKGVTIKIIGGKGN